MAHSSSGLSMTSFWPSIELRLASLDPTTVAKQSVYVSAIITLMWPFSSSSSSLSITASEEDFRLRLSKGQLRVNFNGISAGEVEARGLQIGDKVMISMEGAQYEELPNPTTKDVPWAITFNSRLVMKVRTAAGWSAIDIDSPPIALPASLGLVSEAVEIESTVSQHLSTPPKPEPFSFSQNENEWTTPGLFKRRLAWGLDEPSSAFAIGEQGLFDEEDDYDLEHRRKRPKFSSAYRFLDGSEEGAEKIASGREGSETMPMDGSGTLSYERNEPAAEDEATERSESYATAAENITDSMTLDMPEIPLRDFFDSQNESNWAPRPSHITMPPPPPPTLPPLTTEFSTSETAPDSPSLKPIPSEQLPAISPFLNRGLAGTDYMGAILDSSLRAQEAGMINRAASLVFGTQEVEVGAQTHYDTAPIAIQESSSDLKTGDSANGSEYGIEREFAAPEVFVVPPENTGSAEAPVLTETSTVAPTASSITSGPTIFQQLAAQRRASPSDDDRLTSYDSDKDSLFDDSETEARHHLSNRRTLGRSPLKTVSPGTTPRRSVPYTKPSRLNLETPSTASPGPISAGLVEAMPGPPKTPFLYLPTPSPKVERRGMGFPTSAPPRFGAGGDRGITIDSSPIRRKSHFWGAGREPPSNDLSAYFGRPKRVSEIVPVAEVSPVDKDGDDTGASNTEEEEVSSFSTPNAGTDADEEEEDDELERELGGDFKSGVTTNLSDFPALSSLTWGAVVDVIGVVSRFRPMKRAKSGQKDWYMSIRVVDSSLLVGITATILRPYKEALPTVDVGDVVLLRSFKISSRKRSFVATSTVNSAWAVWKENGKGRPVNISGPPVEYGDQEERYVEDIGAWYVSLDTDTRVEMERERDDNGDDYDDGATVEV